MNFKTNNTQSAVLPHTQLRVSKKMAESINSNIKNNCVPDQVVPLYKGEILFDTSLKFYGL